jgi:hypothetical protein
MAAEIHRRTGLPADEEIVDLALSELVETGLVMVDDPECRSAVTRDSARVDSAIGAVVDISVDAASCRNRCGAPGGGADINITDAYTNKLVTRRPAFGRGPSRNQIVIAKRLPANASVSQRTRHTSWKMSLGKNTMLLSTGVSVVYVAAAVLPEGVIQVSYTLSSPPVKRRGFA